MSVEEGGSGPRLDAARRRLVESVSGTVAAIAYTLAERVGERWVDDLLSAGHEGACEAAIAYDLGSRTPFEGFAWRRIAGAMLDLLRRERARLSPRLAAALGKAAAALEASAEYVTDTHERDGGSASDEAEGAAATAAVGLLCLGGEASDPEARLLQEERRAHVRRAMSFLSERDHRLMTLRYFDGLTFEEAGKELGIHETTARTRHSVAAKKLDAILRPILLGA